LVVTVLVYASLLGFLLTMRRAFMHFYEAPEPTARVASLATVLMLPAFFGYTNYIYDTTTLFFAALGMLLIGRDQWRAYAAFFALAVFNKETAILLLIPFTVRAWPRMPRKHFIAFVAYQLVMFGLSRAVLRHFFGQNPGEYLMPLFLEHNVPLIHPYPLSTFVAWGFVALTLFAHWKTKPVLLRRSLWILVPLVGMCALFGYADELRAYYDAYPTMALLAAPTLAQWMGVSLEARA
jgi:hypothetical protein